jgi:hypothetical protein
MFRVMPQAKRRIFPTREMAALAYHHRVLAVPTNLWLSRSQQKAGTCQL